MNGLDQIAWMLKMFLFLVVPRIEVAVFLSWSAVEIVCNVVEDDDADDVAEDADGAGMVLSTVNAWYDNTDFSDSKVSAICVVSFFLSFVHSLKKSCHEIFSFFIFLFKLLDPKSWEQRKEKDK